MNIQRFAKVAGVLFLVSMVAGGIGEAYVPSKLIVANDAAATVANISNFAFLYRLGFAMFLIESLADVTLALIFYVLLKPVNKHLSLLAAFFGLMAPALFACAELFYFAPSLIMRVGPMNAFSTDQLNALILLSLRFYEFAGMILTAYYGVAWMIRGYLMFRSGYLPKFLGVLMGIGGAGFITRNILLIFAPAYASPLLLALMFPGGLLLMGWLLVKGIEIQQWNTRSAVPGL